MHLASVSANKTEQEWLDIMIRYSRMHWGQWWQPLRWRCELSYRWCDPRFLERARLHARRAKRALDEGRFVSMAVEGAKAVALSPRLAWHRVALPFARFGHWRMLDRARLLRQYGGEPIGRHGDGWIGPVYRADLQVPGAASRLVLRLQHAPPSAGVHRRVSPRLLVDGVLADRQEIRKAGQFELVADLTTKRGRPCRVEVLTPEYFVPRVLGAPDDRKLSALLLEERIE